MEDQPKKRRRRRRRRGGGEGGHTPSPVQGHTPVLPITPHKVVTSAEMNIDLRKQLQDALGLENLYLVTIKGRFAEMLDAFARWDGKTADELVSYIVAQHIARLAPDYRERIAGIGSTDVGSGKGKQPTGSKA